MILHTSARLVDEAAIKSAILVEFDLRSRVAI